MHAELEIPENESEASGHQTSDCSLLFLFHSAINPLVFLHSFNFPLLELSVPFSFSIFANYTRFDARGKISVTLKGSRGSVEAQSECRSLRLVTCRCENLAHCISKRKTNCRGKNRPNFFFLHSLVCA